MRDRHVARTFPLMSVGGGCLRCFSRIGPGWMLTRGRPAMAALACLAVLAAPAIAQEAGNEDLVPVGFGTLLQDEISLTLRSADLLVKATPLAEEVTRLTAPDTYARLSALAAAHRETLEFQTRSTDPVLFLVSVFSYQPDVTYQPEDINIVNQGIRERPLAIQAITPGWSMQRLNQQETQMAIYAFSPFINLDLDLEIEYRDARNAGWQRILTVLEGERAKVRARAGGGSRQWAGGGSRAGSAPRHARRISGATD